MTRREGRWGQLVLGGLAVLALLAACTKGGSVAAPSAGSSPGAPPSAQTSSAATGLLFGSLPAGCDGVAAPPTSSVISFAAAGRIWSFSPDPPGELHCLFTQGNPGLFSWGPRGDRVVLAGLQVRGVGSAAARPAGSFQPSYFSWSRPSGTTVVFTDQARHNLFRADIGVATTSDITPVPGVTYGDIAYHPSGLAIGFEATDSSGSAIWMSTNTGKNPQLLVRAPSGTTFAHIVFAHDGVSLYYSIDRADGTHTLARYDLPTGKVSDGLWKGSAPIADIVELAGVPGLALTLGATCTDRQAVYSDLEGGPGTPLGAGLTGPVSVVGRVDRDRFVVATGGCGGAPQDLSMAYRSGGPPSALLVRSVDVAAMRQPEPTPAPPLPQNLPRSGFA